MIRKLHAVLLTALLLAPLSARAQTNASATHQLTMIGLLQSVLAAFTNPLPVSMAAAPTGAATSAKQDTGNTSLAAIAAALAGTIVTSVTGNVAVTGTFWQATQPVSATTLPLPSNAAQETGGNLASIVTNTGRIPAQGQALAAASLPVVLTAAQLSTLTPPAAIVGFALETGGNLASIVTNTGRIPTTPASEHATAASPHSCRLSDGAAFYSGATETTLSSLNGKVTACNTGAVVVSGALPAGSALVGKVGIDQTTDGTTNRVNATIASGQTVGLVAGSALVGKVGIDQTTPGTTNRVDATIAASQTIGLAAGSAIVGKFGIDQTTDGTTNKVAATLAAETTKVIGTVNLSAGQTLGTVTTVGAVTGITNALPAGTNRIGSVRLVDSADADLTSAKGSQSSRFMGIQEARNAGRTSIVWTANSVASTATAEGLFTLSRSVDLVAGANAIAYTVTSGKRLSIESILIGLEAAGSAPKPSRLKFRIRGAAAGSCGASSPLQDFSVITSSGIPGSSGQAFKVYPNGYEIVGQGDGTKQICFTVETPEWVTGTNAGLIDIEVKAFEY